MHAAITSEEFKDMHDRTQFKYLYAINDHMDVCVLVIPLTKKSAIDNRIAALAATGREKGKVNQNKDMTKEKNLITRGGVVYFRIGGRVRRDATSDHDDVAERERWEHHSIVQKFIRKEEYAEMQEKKSDFLLLTKRMGQLAGFSMNKEKIFFWNAHEIWYYDLSSEKLNYGTKPLG